MFTPASRRCSEDSLRLEIRRQIFHLTLISLWVVPVYLFPFRVNLLIFGIVILVNLLVVLRVSPFYDLFSFLIDLLERKKNLRFPGIQSLYANLGIMTAYLLFEKLAVVGIVTLAVGDSLSTLAGKAVGRHPLFYNGEKTWEGCVAFFLSSFAVLSFLTDIRSALLVASLSALLESVRFPLDDNFLIPVSATALVYLL